MEGGEVTVGQLKEHLKDANDNLEIYMNIGLGKGEINSEVTDFAICTSYKNGSSIGVQKYVVLIYEPKEMD